MPKVEIGICMGSSCFSRGNNKLISDMRKALVQEELEDSTILNGFLCIDACDKGPCVTIDRKHICAPPAQQLVLQIKKIIEEKK